METAHLNEGLRISELDWAFLDVETTGIYRNRDRILEVGIATLDHDGTETLYESLVNPGRHFDNEYIHGVTPEMIESAPGFKDVADDILKHLFGRVVVCFNAEFDVTMLREAFRRIEESMPEIKVVCAKRLAASTISSKIGASLKDVASALGLEEGEKHRAISDAVTCKKVFLRLAKRLGGDVRLADLDPVSFNSKVKSWPDLPYEPTSYTREDAVLQEAPVSPAFPWKLEQLPGKRVALSGNFLGQDGLGLTRKAADIVFRGFGLEVKTVSKKTDFVIVDNLSSQSGKCKDARRLGVPMYLESEFWKAVLPLE